MNPLKVIGAIDDEGKLKETIYVIGSVTQRGANVMHVKNHDDYVDYRGFYNILDTCKTSRKLFLPYTMLELVNFFHTLKQR